MHYGVPALVNLFSECASYPTLNIHAFISVCQYDLLT